LLHSLFDGSVVRERHTVKKATRTPRDISAIQQNAAGGAFDRVVWYWRPMQWTRSKIWTAALAGALIYFPAALYLRFSYVPPVGPPGEKVRLFYMFPKFQNTAFGYVGDVKPFSPTLDALADSTDHNDRSPVLLYENDHLLGPAHSFHADIGELGGGRYSHWTGWGFVFSTSDNSDPNTNGRAYWAVIPPGVSK
jgi:hypothetical protein